jgi:hypothetical protein
MRAKILSLFLPLWLAGLPLWLVGGCIQIEGGAVEARWVLRTPQGNAVTCQDNRARIAWIRFVLLPQPEDDDPCSTDERCAFPCERGVGATPFFIPEGDYLISLQPLDADENPLTEADGVGMPAPLIRQVRTGQSTSLFANLIIVDR